MKPIFLYVENFMCHEKSVIDFTQFSSALIIGKVSNNDLYSNGVGKTTLFKAIEYALFNFSDVNLDKLVRDDCKSCKVVFDCEIDSQVYRVSRTRTRKGTSDLSLFKAVEGEWSFEQLHSETTDSNYWKDISGRRAQDTEKELASLIKINSKSFRSTVHFAQNDFSGITTATPEKRKALLKENLSLAFYSKLEKIAKDKFSLLSKEIEKSETLADNINSSPEEIAQLELKIKEEQEKLALTDKKIKKVQSKMEDKNSSKAKLESAIQQVKSENESLTSQLQRGNNDLNNLLSKIKDLSSQKAAVLSEAKSLAGELNKIKEEKSSLEEIDFSQLDTLEGEIETSEKNFAAQKLILEKNKDKIKQLKVPLPEGTECDYCRQSLSEDHLVKCREDLEKQINLLTEENNKVFLLIKEEEKNIIIFKEKIKKLTQSKARLESLTHQFSLKEEQIKDKKKYYTDINKLIEDYTSQKSLKEEEIFALQEKLTNSSLGKATEMETELKDCLKEIESFNQEQTLLNKELTAINNSIAVNQFSLAASKENLGKKALLIKELRTLKEKAKIYPKVAESFSSSGIPNLIIQNLLDELQFESNTLLNNLKPGLQIQFVTEKENKDGAASDTLDILYFVQGKSREYEQLSGAMKLAVNFSLKLGLSFLLQKMFDTKVNLLLLDEIDQSLDKAGVDAFAEIVKFFQKDFTILVITHNDRIKDKFVNKIVVEQNKDMVSNAKVVNF